MTSNIDERVVGMKFDNRQFEQGVSTSINTLGRLNNSLKLEGATKGLAAIETKAKGFSLDSIGSSVEKAASKFNAFGAMGFSVIQNLTNQALEAGKSIISSFVDPFVEGGQRRALTIEQAKFSFAGLGMDIEKTMASARAAVLGTAYGLDDAAKAAAMFGASGMRAGDKMTASLRAIAGVAAMTGSSYADIADIFTNVAGKGKAQTEDFNRLAARGLNGWAALGKVLGKTEAQVHDMAFNSEISFQMFADAMDKSFGEHAQDANKTFEGALSNMRAALSRFGADLYTPDYEDKRIIFNALTPQIDKLHAAMMPLFNVLAGYGHDSAKQFVDMISKLDFTELTKAMPIVAQAVDNVHKFLVKLLDIGAGAFKEIFPPSDAKLILNIANTLKALSDKLTLTWDKVWELQRVFKGVFAAVDIGIRVVKAFFGMLGNVIKRTDTGGTSLLTLAARLGDWIVRVDEALKNGEDLTKFFGKLENVLVVPIMLLKAAGAAIAEAFAKLKGDGKGASAAAEQVGAALEKTAGFGEAVSKVWHKITAVIAGVWKIFEPIASKVALGLGSLVTKFSSAFSDFGAQDWVNLFNTGMLSTALILLRNWVLTFKGLFTGQSKFTLVSQLKAEMLTLSNTLNVMQAQLKAGTLLTIALAIGILAGSMFLLSKVNPDRLASAGAAMLSLMGSLIGMTAAINKMNTVKDTGKMMATAAGLILLAIALDIMASAVVKMADLSWQQIAKGLTGIVVVLGALVGFMHTVPDNTKLAGTAIAIGLLGISLKIIASAVKDLGSIDLKTLGIGLGAMAVILAEIVGFLQLVKIDKMAMSKGVGLIFLALAIKILASAVEQFGNLNEQQIAKGLGVMAGVLAEIAGFSQILKRINVGSAVAMVVVAASLLILGKALEELGNLSWMQILKGLVTMGIAMGFIAGAMQEMSGAFVGSAAFLLAAVSLLIIGQVMTTFGEMPWNNIGKAMTMLFGTLLLIALGLTAMIETLPGSAALLVAAAALAVLAPILLAFGNMSWGDIAKGLVMLAGVFAVFGIAGSLLAPVVPVLMGLAGAIALVGLAFLAAGAGVWLLGAGLIMLEAALVGAVGGVVAIVGAVIGMLPMIVEVLGHIIMVVIRLIGEAAPGLLNTIVIVLSELAKAVIKLSPVLVGAMVQLISDLLKAVTTLSPQMETAFVVFMMCLLNAINIVGPMIINTLVVLILALLNAIVILVPAFVDAGMQILVGILNGIANNIGQVVDAGVNIVVQFLEGIGRNIPKMIQAGADLLVDFLDGFAQGINDNAQRIQESGGRVAKAIIDGMTGGLATKAGEVIEKAKSVAGDIIAAFKQVFDSHSPSRVTHAIGEFVVDGLINGILIRKKRAAEAATGLGQTMVNALSAATAGFADSVDSNPTIRPVIDLTDVQNGARQINGMFAPDGISVNGAYSTASTVAQNVTSPNDVVSPAVPVAPVNGGTTVAFTQYNYSPKELSALDIYRNTQKQLSALKGALSTP